MTRTLLPPGKGAVRCGEMLLNMLQIKEFKDSHEVSLGTNFYHTSTMRSTEGTLA
jgi:hypothetical protein